MTKNPFPQTLKDEASGTEVPNQRYQDWEAGYAAAVKDAARIVLSEIQKALGTKFPAISAFIDKLR